MSISKRRRKNGAITIVENGKIVGNFGRGKTDIPAVGVDVSKMSHEVSSLGSVSSTVKKSSLSVAQAKFAMLKVLEDKNDTLFSVEQAETLWLLTENQPLVERLKILNEIVPNMSESDAEKFQDKNLEEDFLLDEDYEDCYGYVVWTPKTSLMLSKHYASDIRWRVAENDYTPPNVLDILVEDVDPDVVVVVARNPSASLNALTRIVEIGSPHEAVAEAKHQILMRTGM